MRLSLVLRNVPLLIAIALPVALLGCATPSPLIRLDPTARNVTWISGRAAVQKEADGVRVATAFEQQDGNRLQLRVEIQNLREEKLEIEPHRFSFTTCHGDTLESCCPTEKIIDPEEILAAIDRHASRQEADAANSQTTAGALIFLSVLADIGDSHGNTVAAVNHKNIDALRHDNARASLSGRRQIWSNVALRRNTLQPGGGVAGDVFLPIDLKATVVWLHVRGDGWRVSFPFRQTITQVDEPSGPPHATNTSNR